MIITCKHCNNSYNIARVGEEQIAHNDKYCYPLFIDDKEYMHIKCECGAICIKSVEK